MWTEDQYEDFVAESYSYLRSVQETLKRNWSLGSYERFDWNQEHGTMVFSDQGVPKLVAEIQFVGSISNVTETWLWSWDNSSILDPCKDRIHEVRTFGQRHELCQLTTAKWKAAEEDGWAMTAISANILRAQGAYRSPTSDGFTFFIFTDLRLAESR